MAQPTPYSRVYNFTNYQAVNPSTPLPAAQVDLELNTIKATLDQTLNNLKLIQRDDTALANASVGKDQLKAEITIGINPPSPWVTAHAYIANDTVFTGGVFYLCLVSHTSGTFATDLAANKWSVVADFTAVSFDLANATHTAVAKTTPTDSDEFPLADGAASWGLKKSTWGNFKTTMLSAWGALVAGTTGKSTPVDADTVAIGDSAATNATKSLTMTNLASYVLGKLGPFIVALTGKTTPVGADAIVIADSAASNAAKDVTLTNFWTATLAAFGPLVAALTAKTTPADGDGVMLVDSAASSAPKFTTFTQMWANYFKGKADALYLAPTLTGILNLGSTGQIKFPATQNDSADVNTLDDYEEGTFTPAFSATGCTFSYAARSGRYVKIGRQVTIQARIALNTSGNTLAGNSLTLTGLPFAAETQAGNVASGTLVWGAYAASLISAACSISSGSSSINMLGLTAGAIAQGGLVGTSLSATAGSVTSITITYFV